MSKITLSDGATERVWHFGSKYKKRPYLVHVFHRWRIGALSGPTSRNIWRLQYGNVAITLKYGVAEDAELS